MITQHCYTSAAPRRATACFVNQQRLALRVNTKARQAVFRASSMGNRGKGAKGKSGKKGKGKKGSGGGKGASKWGDEGVGRDDESQPVKKKRRLTQVS